VLIADRSGIDLWTEEGSTALLTGREITVAIPDLEGGVIFQGMDDDTIEWIRVVGEEPITLIESEVSGIITPLQAARIGGEPQFLYTRQLRYDTGEQTEMLEFDLQLVLHNLKTHVERVLGIMGSFESSGTSIDVAADRAAIAWTEYGDAGGCAGVIDLADLLDLDPDRWVASLCGPGCCRFGPTPGCGFGIPCQGDAHGALSVTAALSEDGQRLAVGERLSVDQTRLTVFDLETDTVLAELPIEDHAALVKFIDFYRETILITVSSNGHIHASLVTMDGTETPLPDGNSHRIWRDSPSR